MKYPEDIDVEITPLLEAFNDIEGLRTDFSCCGHGDGCFYISFEVKDIEIEHLIIERFSRIGYLQFRFKFFEIGHFGIYSDVLGKMPELMRVNCYQYMITQCRNITAYLNELKKHHDD